MTAPNLLFIFSDQHSASVCGCYGDEIAMTPSLDRLASGGVVFDSAYCASPICTPSRMSMMSGKYPHNSKVWGNNDILSSAIPTMAHSLGYAGYDPCLVGRLHSVGPDQKLGYSARLVGDHHPNWVGMPRVDMGQLEGTASPDRRSLKYSGAGQSAYEIKDRDVADAAMRKLDELAEELSTGQRDRFAMTVGLMLPHAPFVASAKSVAGYEGKVGLANKRPPASDREHPWIHRWREHRNILDVTEQEEIRARAAYYALVESMDAMIGDVLDKLESLGLAENTLVIYASDHGEQIGERGLWWKHTFYEESVRVPLIMRWPGVLPSGQRRKQVVSLVDTTATILDALQAPELPGIDGKSFLAMAKDEKADWRDIAFSEYSWGSKFDWGLEAPGQIRMVRSGPFKLIYYNDAPVQLFNLDEDPDELNDLASDPDHKDIVEQLSEKLFDGWNPKSIGREIEAQIPAKEIFHGWAAKVRPQSTDVWEMKPEHNRLD